MRFPLTCAVALSFAVVPFTARPAALTVAMAPADETFGRFGQSVLEIRNRIERFDAKSDDEIKTPELVGAMDYVEDGVMDWQEKYPTDPWVVEAMARLVESYARAEAFGDPRASDVLERLQSAYPKSALAGEAMLAMAGAAIPEEEAPAQTPQTGPVRATIVGEVVDASSGKPVPGAVVLIAPDKESSDLLSTAFATTGNDGSFAVNDVPLGAVEYIIVQPPRGSAYASYHGVVDGANGKVHAGIIRLASR